MTVISVFTTLTGCESQEPDFVFSSEADSLEADSMLTESELQTRVSEAVPSPTVQVQLKTEIYVDVAGAVTNPGVYILDEGGRIFQAVEAAGGFLPEADQTYVNQAQVLSDGQQIYIPTREETESCPVPVRDAVQDLTAEPDAENRVDLNTADKELLMTLPGIGESKAQAILAYREAQGVFSSIEEIMNVQGIKESTFTKIKDDIVVR